MFTLAFMEDTGELPPFNIAVFDDMFTALRWVRGNIAGSHAWEWRFDGDCLHTNLNKPYEDAAGNLYAGGYSIILD